jgi:hypothetical protein
MLFRQQRHIFQAVIVINVSMFLEEPRWFVFTAFLLIQATQALPIPMLSIGCFEVSCGGSLFELVNGQACEQPNGGPSAWIPFLSLTAEHTLRMYGR